VCGSESTHFATIREFIWFLLATKLRAGTHFVLDRKAIRIHAAVLTRIATKTMVSNTSTRLFGATFWKFAIVAGEARGTANGEDTLQYGTKLEYKKNARHIMSVHITQYTHNRVV
jgi:hypothetical protein